MPPKSADVSKSQPDIDIRKSVCGSLQGLFTKNGFGDVESKVFSVERALYNATVRVMVQNSEALWKPIYTALFSNLWFNITNYKHCEENLQQLEKNPDATINSIVINGPLLLNRQLDEIKTMQQEGGGAPKVSSNTGGRVRCPRCGQNEIYRALVQDRGGDEAFSGYYSCLNDECGYQWRRSGG